MAVYDVHRHLEGLLDVTLHEFTDFYIIVKELFITKVQCILF